MERSEDVGAVMSERNEWNSFVCSFQIPGGNDNKQRMLLVVVDDSDSRGLGGKGGVLLPGRGGEEVEA